MSEDNHKFDFFAGAGARAGAGVGARRGLQADPPPEWAPPPGWDPINAEKLMANPAPGWAPPPGWDPAGAETIVCDAQIAYVLCGSTRVVRKTLTWDNHLWIRNLDESDVLDVFPNRIDLLRRVADLSRELGERGFGPRVYRVDCYERAVVLYMEYLPSCLTYDAFKADPDRVFRAILRLHAAGFVHGDLHPDNIRINTAGEVRFIDFDTTYRETEVNSEAWAPVIREITETPLPRRGSQPVASPGRTLPLEGIIERFFLEAHKMGRTAYEKVELSRFIVELALRSWASILKME